MNVSELLSPLVEKAITSKGYIREVAVERSRLWLSKEIGVPVNSLHNLTYEQAWTAQAVVEKALLPPPRKRKVKMVIPDEMKRIKEQKPLGKKFWLTLQREWGTEFYCRFFGDFTTEKVEGTLAPGQLHVQEIKKANSTALLDVA